MEHKALPEIILLNTIGELSKVYAKISIAFIGGSLVPVGGHNILEPAYWSIPILFGPYMHNFPVAKEFLARSAALKVATAEEISEAVKDLLLHDERAVTLGKNEKAIVEKNKGAVHASIELVRRLIGTA